MLELILPELYSRDCMVLADIQAFQLILSIQYAEEDKEGEDERGRGRRNICRLKFFYNGNQRCT